MDDIENVIDAIDFFVFLDIWLLLFLLSSLCFDEQLKIISFWIYGEGVSEMEYWIKR